jgi:hypothetical protein
MQGYGDGDVLLVDHEDGTGMGRKDIRWEVIFAGSMSGKGRTGLGEREGEKAERGISFTFTWP